MRSAHHPFLWLGIAWVAAPGPVSGQGGPSAGPENVASAPARPLTAQPPATMSTPRSAADQPAQPTPALRLIASEPDLSSLPQVALPENVNPAFRSEGQGARAEQRSQPEASRQGASASGNAPNEAESRILDHALDRIAALPAAPEITAAPLKATASSPLRAGRFRSLAGRVDTFLHRANLPPWLPGVAAGMIAFVVAWVFWRLRRRRRTGLAMEDEAPIQWGPPDDSEVALRTMLLARRAETARGRAVIGLRQNYATLGEALIAMKTATAKPVPHPASEDRSRAVGA